MGQLCQIEKALPVLCTSNGFPFGNSYGCRSGFGISRIVAKGKRVEALVGKEDFKQTQVA